MGKYASGKYALRVSDRSGQSFPYNEMVQEWNGSWVHVSEFEPKSPRLNPENHPTDFEALQYARPQVISSTVFASDGLATNSYDTLVQSVTLADGTVIKQRSMMPLSVQQPNKDIILQSNTGIVTVVIS